VALRLQGALDAPALERALGELVRRHEALRTVFRETDGAPVQVIAPFAGFALAVEELAAPGADQREAEAARLAAREAARPFDLAAGRSSAAGSCGWTPGTTSSSWSSTTRSPTSGAWVCSFASCPRCTPRSWEGREPPLPRRRCSTRTSFRLAARAAGGGG